MMGRSPLLLIAWRSAGRRGAAAAAEARHHRAARADVEHVRVEVDDPLHVLVRLHPARELEGLVAEPREDDGGDDGGRCEDGLRRDAVPMDARLGLREDDRRHGDREQPAAQTRGREAPELGPPRFGIDRLEEREGDEEHDAAGELEHDHQEGVRAGVGAGQVRRAEEDAEEDRPASGEDEVPRVVVLDARHQRQAEHDHHEQHERRDFLRREGLLQHAIHAGHVAHEEGDGEAEEHLQEEDGEHLLAEALLDLEGQLVDGVRVDARAGGGVRDHSRRRQATVLGIA
mmetsp:Transcript_61455/g.147988  ORF Transcript_61455/g.147988 Transcript_61455/m.147988 type:complete len:287 (+) Transcript_61455:232-1092(+)